MSTCNSCVLISTYGQSLLSQARALSLLCTNFSKTRTLTAPNGLDLQELFTKHPNIPCLEADHSKILPKHSTVSLHLMQVHCIFIHIKFNNTSQAYTSARKWHNDYLAQPCSHNIKLAYFFEAFFSSKPLTLFSSYVNT